MDRITVVTDTREKEPYGFESGITKVVRRALPAGDYSIEGCEDSVAVERKTLEDFVSSVIRSRKRFTKELRRLSAYDAACVVVEADLRDVLQVRYRSGAHPNAVLGALLSIVVDFDAKASREVTLIFSWTIVRLPGNRVFNSRSVPIYPN